MDLDKSNARQNVAGNTGRVDRFGRVVHLDETAEPPADGSDAPPADADADAALDDSISDAERVATDPTGADPTGAGTTGAGTTSAGTSIDGTSIDDTTEIAAIDDFGANASDWSATATDHVGAAQDLGLDPAALRDTSAGAGAGAALAGAGAVAAGAATASALTDHVADVVPSQIEIIAPPTASAPTPGSVQWSSPRPVTATPPRRRRLGFLVPLAAAAVLAFIITLIVVRNRSNNSSDAGSATQATTSAAAAQAATTAGAKVATTTGAVATTASVAVSASTAPAGAAPITEATSAPTVAPATATPATTATASGAVTATADDEVNLFTPVRWAVYSGGKVELLGNVPSKAIADDIAKRAAAVVGPENVTVSYVIDPTAPLPKSAPLYVRDLILFDVDSAELKAGSNQLLDLGVVLMQNNPAVKIRVLGRADNRGDPAANVQLSLTRAKSVINYVAARGIDAARLTPVALGSEAPVADNTTDDGMAQNRSVGFVITGFVS